MNAWSLMKSNMTLEEKIDAFQQIIDNYEPETKWEAANNRTLKRLVQRRNALEKLARQKNRADSISGRCTMVTVEHRFDPGSVQSKACDSPQAKMDQ